MTPYRIERGMLSFKPGVRRRTMVLYGWADIPATGEAGEHITRTYSAY